MEESLGSNMILKHFEICLIVIINSGFVDIYLYEFFHVGVGSSALKLPYFNYMLYVCIYMICVRSLISTVAFWDGITYTYIRWFLRLLHRLRHALVTWGDKFTPKEVNDAFDQMYIDDKGFIDTPSLIAMLTGTGEEEEE